MRQKFDIKNLRTGHFVLYKSTGDFFNKLISDHQTKMGLPKEHCQYTHVDVLGPRQWAIRVNPPKAKKVEIDKYYKGREAIIVKYRHEDFDKRRQYVAWWAATHNNLTYDYLGVLKFKIGWIWHKKNLYFCSENAAWALRQEFPEALKNIPEFSIMPAHFLGNDFDVVWHGIIE